MADKKSLLSVIQGISLAVHNTMDGARDKDGEKIDIGLQRDNKEMPVIDGFNVKFSGNKMCVKYHSDLPVKYAKEVEDFKKHLDDIFANIIKFIKKKYKEYMEKEVSFKKVGDPTTSMETISLARSWVIATQWYDISGFKTETHKTELDDVTKKFLAIGKDKYPNTEKPKNVTRKKEKGPENKVVAESKFDTPRIEDIDGEDGWEDFLLSLDQDELAELEREKGFEDPKQSNERGRFKEFDPYEEEESDWDGEGGWRF